MLYCWVLKHFHWLPFYWNCFRIKDQVDCNSGHQCLWSFVVYLCSLCLLLEKETEKRDNHRWTCQHYKLFNYSSERKMFCYFNYNIKKTQYTWTRRKDNSTLEWFYMTYFSEHIMIHVIGFHKRLNLYIDFCVSFSRLI